MAQSNDSGSAKSVELRGTRLLALGAALAPAPILPTTSIDRLLGFPNELSTAFRTGAFEVRLDEDDRVDFETAVMSGNGDRERFASEWLARCSRAAFSQTPAWRAIDSFVRAWSDPDHALHDAVRMFWLEFDAALVAGAPLEPFLIFTLSSERFYPEGKPLRGRLFENVTTGLEILGGALEAKTRDGVGRFIAALPDCAHLMHAAIRPGQANDAVRFVVRMPRSEVTPLLDAVGWLGDSDGFATWLDRYCPLTTIHSFNFDVGAAVGAKVGTEFHFRASPRKDPRWVDLFDSLERDGACTAAKRDAISGWPSTAREAGFALLDDRGEGIVLDRDLLVKVVYEGPRPLSAKAYLSYTPQLTPRALD